MIGSGEGDGGADDVGGGMRGIHRLLCAGVILLSMRAIVPEPYGRAERIRCH